MEAQLQALSLDYRLFKAVDGEVEWDKISQRVNIQTFERNVGRVILPGEIGCYLSHIGVWQDFLDSGRDVALVLEDDILLHHDFRVAMQHGLASIDKWDMLKLSRIRAKFPVKQDVIGDYQLSAFVGTFTGMGAYLITRSCAKRLLPDMFPISQPIDHALDRIDLRTFRHFALQPFPCHADDRGDSMITGVGFNKVKKFHVSRRMNVYQNRARALVKKGFHLALGRIGFFRLRNAN